MPYPLLGEDHTVLLGDVPAGIAMVHDRRAGTYVAVLRAHGRAFALRDDAEQAHLVEGWAEVLASMADADSPIARLQVLERTLPDTGKDADRDDGVKRILVVDEAWKVLTRLEVARWLQENWKLTRSTAVQCIAVIHRLSDLEAAGGRDSEQVRLARGLLSDSETKVIFQDPAELALVRELCQLSERETAVVGGLPRGCALWRVGQRSFQVEHHLSAWEQREVTYTDDRMKLALAALFALRTRPYGPPLKE